MGTTIYCSCLDVVTRTDAIYVMDLFGSDKGKPGDTRSGGGFVATYGMVNYFNSAVCSETAVDKNKTLS